MISKRALPVLVALMVAGSGSACASESSGPAPDSAPTNQSTTAAPETASLPDDESGHIPKLRKDGADPVPADLRQLASIFVEYAVGQRRSLPLSDSVSLALGGTVVASIDRFRAAPPTRPMWQGCPVGADLYGASSCPVDLLGPVKGAAVNRTTLTYSADYGDVTCAPDRSGPVPGGRVVVIRPSPDSRSCSGDFALVLGADVDGRLLSLDLTLSEP